MDLECNYLAYGALQGVYRLMEFDCAIPTEGRYLVILLLLGWYTTSDGCPYPISTVTRTYATTLKGINPMFKVWIIQECQSLDS